MDEAILVIHASVLACHCECLAMNAENMKAAIENAPKTPFDQEHYRAVMRKWKIIDDEGRPTFLRS